jgi:DNA-directed RNA polymerase subunit RPC12/RpoP
MYKCWNCGLRFEEPDYEDVCWEELYGVGDMFERKTYGRLATCPHCGSDEIEEGYEGEDDEFDE